MAEQGLKTEVLLDLIGVDSGSVASRPLLRNISLSLSTGEIAVVLGGNGAGKTTLLRTAAGILVPHRGQIQGPGATGFNPGYSGMILEEPQSQFVSGTARGEIEFALESQGWPRKQIQERTRELVGQFSLEAFGDRDPRTLSAGEQGRCLIAAALGPRPRVLFLDDPFLHMDPGLWQPIWERLNAAVKSQEVGAILVAAHDAELAVTATTVGILDHGVLTAWGSPESVLRGRLPDSIEKPLGVWLENRLKEQGWELSGQGLDGAGLVRRILADLER